MAEVDKLNNLETESNRSLPYEQYFGEMDLTEEQKKERISFAEQIQEVMTVAFMLINMEVQMGSYEYAYIIERIASDYQEIYSGYMEVDKDMVDYTVQFANEVVDTTIDNMMAAYYLSLDRAMFIAENEANTSLNYKDFKQALMDGKKNKKWIGIRDSHQRKDHSRVTGEVKPIYEPFIVGGVKMQYPKDIDAPAKQVVNCRCSIKYIK